MVTSSSDPASTHSGVLSPGAAVHVRTRFDGSWAPGFAVEEIIPGESGEAQYRLRRKLDGAVLPGVFPEGDVVAASSVGAST